MSPSFTANSNRQSLPTAFRLGAITLLALYLLLRSQHNFTQLTPEHPALRLACYFIAGTVGIFGCILALTRPGNALAAVAVLIGGGFFTYMVCSEATGLIAGAIDFPAAQLSSYTALLPITDAYTTHSRSGHTFHIHTTPRADLLISRSDYEILSATQSHPDYDSVNVNGDFSVHVTLQRSGDALRILHPAFGALPEGSLSLCPPSLNPIH